MDVCEREKEYEIAAELPGWKLSVAAGKAANLVGERPMPSIARFGRLAYPMRGEVTNRAVLGRKRHGRPGIRSGWPAVGTTWVASKLGGLKIIE